MLIVVPGVVYALAARVVRRALPLAALLKMTLVFPDKAPTRMAVARKAGSTRALERKLAEARERGIKDEPSVAAEQILALATSLNKHDRLTRGHSERVRAVTDLIAEELSLPQGDRDRLRWSALLHDIGKLTVPGSILNKPGKPDDIEWLLLKSHPLAGARLAAPLGGWLGPWADSIAQHHEKYDGTGYPYGLAGEGISLGGRIVAVADCYETMTAVRSYKAAMTPAAARRELAACAGSHFDPVIVRAFLGASVGRLGLLGGPLSLLGELPPMNAIPQLGQLVSVAGQGLAAVAAVAGISIAAALGSHHSPTLHPQAVVSLIQRSQPGPTKVSTPPLSSTPPLARPTSPFNNSPPTPTRPTPPTIPTPPPVTSSATPDPPGRRAPSAAVMPATTPTAPTGVSGVSGDSEVMLSWAAPLNDGGTAVTGYTVTPYVGAVAQSATVFSSTATAQTVGGLTNGTSYTFAVTATNEAGSSPASALSAAVTPAAPVTPSTVRIINGTGTVGQADAGDQIIVTYSAPPAASQFCSSWTASSHPDLSGANVYAAGQQQVLGDDTFSVFDGALSDCGGVFNFGWIDLGQAGYFTGTVIFNDSTIHWDGVNTLTITLGAPDIAVQTQAAPSVGVYHPDPALGLVGSISSPDETQF